MGLDSIELVIETEKYFRIQIPDAEAEKIYTVQDMVNTVAQHLNITSESTSLQGNTFLKICSCIQKLRIINSKMLLTDKISGYLPAHDKESWDNLENCLMLKVPMPDSYDPKSNKFSDKLKKLISWTPSYDWQTISVSQFTDAICAHNCYNLIDIEKLNSKYEIYIGVMRITVDKIGVDYYEILPDKSFTNDLGID